MVERKTWRNVERKKGWTVVGEGGGGRRREQLKNSPIYRHPISFPITRTSETRDLFGLFSYGTFFGTISKEKFEPLCPRLRHPCSSLPSISRSLFPRTDGSSHTITIDHHRTNIRIFVIPFAGYIESVFLSTQTPACSPPYLLSSPSVSSLDNWYTEKKQGEEERGGSLIVARAAVLIRVNRELDAKRTRLFRQLGTRKVSRTRREISFTGRCASSRVRERTRTDALV